MLFGYANGNARQAVSTQIEAIRSYNPKIKVGVEAKGSDEEFDRLIDAREERKALGRGSGHSVVVAEFHHLATYADCLFERLKIIHEKGSFVVEAATGRSTEDRVALLDMAAEAIDFYRYKLTRKDRSRIGALAAKHSPRAKEKPGRMPLEEAAAFLTNAAYGRKGALMAINADDRFKVKWTDNYLQYLVSKRRIILPLRKSGPKPKQ